MEDFCKALRESYDDEMVCMLSDVLDGLTATDVNFEIISSQTAKPLLMFYNHNMVQELKAYVIIQSHLNGFDEPNMNTSTHQESEVSSPQFSFSSPNLNNKE